MKGEVGHKWQGEGKCGKFFSSVYMNEKEGYNKQDSDVSNIIL